jgi:hypoxanthine-DNA glycosylase
MSNTIHSFTPIVNQETEILILGTMPGKTSLELQEYYAYKHNHFWRIIFTLFDVMPVAANFDDKIALLQINKIGLWDVLQHCERSGSLDNQIKNQKENDFETLLKDYPSIKKIVFNGKESQRYFVKKFKQIKGITYYEMPSTSPANTMPFDKKLKLWKTFLS